ncbi:hypothetical protein M5K25_006464 [Dendrobium thyrsiflorum]|uniref:Uncharacterized protein n=1 Tax=Dendrobium thyrsiflorum TaxID=117978 RepID=A0ABD0VCQ6_DENTH
MHRIILPTVQGIQGWSQNVGHVEEPDSRETLAGLVERDQSGARCGSICQYGCQLVEVVLPVWLATGGDCLVMLAYAAHKASKSRSSSRVVCLPSSMVSPKHPNPNRHLGLK